MRQTIPLIPWLLVLASCSSPPKPPTVDETQKRPVNSQMAVELQVCKNDLQNTRLLATESGRVAETTAATLANLAARQQILAAMQGAPGQQPKANSVFTVRFDFGSTRVVIPADVAATVVEDAKASPLVMLRGRTDGTLTYTLDGSNPRDGLPYEGPFEIGSAAARLLVYARAGEANKTADFQIPASGDKTVQINDTKPVKLQPKRIGLDTTDRVFGVINRFRDQPGTLFKGVRIEIGEGEKTVTVRFQEREVTASVIEGVINSLRMLLAEDQAPVVVNISDGAHFDTGFAAKEFAKLVGLELKPGDVVQEA